MDILGFYILKDKWRNCFFVLRRVIIILMYLIFKRILSYKSYLYGNEVLKLFNMKDV